jgi:hypothetical protein
LLAALRECGRERDLWRLQLQAEDALLPRELARLVELAPLLPRPVQSWLGRIAVLGQFGDAAPQRFSRKHLAPNICLYGDPAVPRRTKALVIAFCGNGNRLMMPIACVLQHLPSDKCDILILRDTKRTHFSALPPYARSMVELIGRVAAEVEADRYRKNYCYGTCSGGFAALRAGLLLKADRAVAVSGSFPWHPRRLLEEPENALPAFDPLCNCHGRAGTTIVCAYGAESAKDREAATLLGQIRPVTHIAAPDVAEHNLVKVLARRGRLGAFFNEVFELGGAAEIPARTPALWQSLKARSARRLWPAAYL